MNLIFFKNLNNLKILITTVKNKNKFNNTQLKNINKSNYMYLLIKNYNYINSFNTKFKNLKNYKQNIIFFKISIEFILYNKYKQLFLVKKYSNYNLNLLYTLSILNSDTSTIFDLNSNSIINIRKPYKSSNSLLIKKTNLIDLLLKKYIETTLESRVSINFDKYNITFLKKKSIFLKLLKRRMRRITRLLRGSNLSLRTFIRVTFIFMCTKDLDLFSKILLKIMNFMHYKNHRRFLYYLKLFITKSMSFYFDILKFEGFFFYLSGKISGGGNSKKKHYVVKHGKYSLTNKILKLKYKKGLIHTKTGVMGYRFMVSYK